MSTIAGFDSSGNMTATSIVTVGANASVSTVKVGPNAGAAITSGANHVCVGQNSGMNITTGWGNTIVGSGSGQNIITGDSNVICGVNSGQMVTDGVQNTIVGGSSNVVANNVSNGVAVGYVSSASTDSVAVGYNATTGSSSVSGCVAIGTNANAGYSGSTAIGYGAQATAANQICLGTSSNTVSIPGQLNAGIQLTPMSGSWAAGSSKILPCGTQSATITGSMTSATISNGTTTNMTINIIRIGGVVILQWSGSFVDGGAFWSCNNPGGGVNYTLPAGAAPTTSVIGIVPLLSNDAMVSGQVGINTSGVLSFWGLNGSGPFISSTNCGIYGGSIVYISDPSNAGST